MSNTDLYFQCSLSQGNTHQIAYIEQRGASVGNEVEIPAGSKSFWSVDSVGFPGIAKARIKEIQDDYHKGFASL